LQGKSDTDIAEIIGISRTTVHFHIERAKKKLGVKTRTQAAAMIVTLGYLKATGNNMPTFYTMGQSRPKEAIDIESA